MSVEKSDSWRQKQPLYPDVGAQDHPYPPNPTTTVVVEQPGSGGGYVREERRRTFVGQIVTSCIVTWCCCTVFGIVAFILAMVANNKSANGKSEEAKRMGRASCWVSVAGMVMGFLLGAIILGVYIGLVMASMGHFKYIVEQEQQTSPP